MALVLFDGAAMAQTEVSRKTQLRVLAELLGALALSACAVHPSSPPEVCTGYLEPSGSPYVLPFEKGTSHPVLQGNCAPQDPQWTHHEKMRYAYDFGMPIGTKIVAARTGMVLYVREQFRDDEHAEDQGNALVIVHEDQSTALYGHMTQNGVLVEVGAKVEQGQVIALSGNSGMSPEPHLHFQVQACPDFDQCASVPVTFRNARPNPGRLSMDEAYAAE